MAISMLNENRDSGSDPDQIRVSLTVFVHMPTLYLPTKSEKNRTNIKRAMIFRNFANDERYGFLRFLRIFADVSTCPMSLKNNRFPGLEDTCLQKKYRGDSMRTVTCRGRTDIQTNKQSINQTINQTYSRDRPTYLAK